MHPDPETNAEGTASATQPENQVAGGNESSTEPPAADTRAESGAQNIPTPGTATDVNPPVAGTSPGVTVDSNRPLRTILSSEEDFSALREPLLDEPL